MAEKKYTPCGGCGAETPLDRCIGCLHPFESESPAEQPVVNEWDSERMIGCVRERFKELEEKKRDWASFYNGWLEGRADMLQQLKGLGKYKAPEQPVREVEADMFNFTEWCHENAVAQYENKRFHSWRLFGPNADDKDHTTAQLYQLFKKQKEK